MKLIFKLIYSQYRFLYSTVDQKVGVSFIKLLRAVMMKMEMIFSGYGPGQSALGQIAVGDSTGCEAYLIPTYHNSFLALLMAVI